MAPKKRPAVRAHAARRAVPVESKTTESLCEAIAAELQRYEHRTPAVETLIATLPHLYPTEHEFQRNVLRMVVTEFNEVKVGLIKEVNMWAGVVATKEEARLAFEAEGKKLQQAQLRLREAEIAVADAEKAEKRHKQQLDDTRALKQAVKGAIVDLYRPLMDGSLHADPEEGYAARKLDELVKAIQPLRMDCYLRRTALHGLRQEPFRRSASQTQAIIKLGCELDHKVATLEVDEMSTATGDKSCTAARMAAKARWEEINAEVEAARTEVEKVLAASGNIMAEAVENARSTAAATKANLKTFVEGPFACLREFCRRCMHEVLSEALNEYNECGFSSTAAQNSPEDPVTPPCKRLRASTASDSHSAGAQDFSPRKQCEVAVKSSCSAKQTFDFSTPLASS